MPGCLRNPFPPFIAGFRNLGLLDLLLYLFIRKRTKKHEGISGLVDKSFSQYYEKVEKVGVFMDTYDSISQKTSD